MEIKILPVIESLILNLTPCLLLINWLLMNSPVRTEIKRPFNYRV